MHHSAHLGKSACGRLRTFGASGVDREWKSRNIRELDFYDLNFTSWPGADFSWISTSANTTCLFKIWWRGVNESVETLSLSFLVYPFSFSLYFNLDMNESERGILAITKSLGGELEKEKRKIPFWVALWIVAQINPLSQFHHLPQAHISELSLFNYFSPPLLISSHHWTYRWWWESRKEEEWMRY